jgi:hypothetical protein
MKLGMTAVLTSNNYGRMKIMVINTTFEGGRNWSTLRKPLENHRPVTDKLSD